MAAGYSRDGGGCVAIAPHGAMGYDHQNDALLDDHLENPSGLFADWNPRVRC